MTKKNTFKCNKSWGDILDKLPDANRLQVYDAIFLYARTRTSPELDLMSEVAFTPIRAELDGNLEGYDSLCQRNKDNIGKRWNNSVSENIPNDTKVYQTIPNDTTPSEENEKDEEKETEKEKCTKEKDIEKEDEKEKEEEKLLKEKKPAKPFTPPTYAQVKEYFLISRRPDLNPQDFLDYYESVGWVVGPRKKKMTSWRGAAGGWMSRNKNHYTERKEILLQDTSSLGELNKWMLKYTPNIVGNVGTLLTQEELDALKEVWTSKEIADVLTKLDNRPDLCRKYANLYTTLRSWLEKGHNNGSYQ